MNLRTCVALMALLLTGAVAAAGAEDRAESKARDASAAFVATQDFIVGRIGRDCLAEMARSETPRDYLEKWRHDNAKYYDAATKYIGLRLNQIEDPQERDTVEQGYYNSVQQKGEAAVNEWFKRGPKDEVCKYAVTLIDAGSMDIEEFGNASKMPIMQDLAALVEWAKAH